MSERATNRGGMVGGQWTFCCDDRLGDCRIMTGLGRTSLDRADRVSLKNDVGDVSIEYPPGTRGSRPERATRARQGARSPAGGP